MRRGLGTLEVWARPASRRDSIEWDEWRRRWIVSCREPPTEGRANAAILDFLAKQLGVTGTAVRLVTGGRTRAKLVEVDALTDSEIAERLHHSHSRAE